MDNSSDNTNNHTNSHIVTWCDIPVTDMNRAKTFYTQVLGLSFMEHPVEQGEMAVFKGTPDQVSGSLVKMEGYTPAEKGTIVYLNGGSNLETPLGRVKENGGEVVLPKTPISEDGCGYFAQFLDCEGNRVGLYSTS